MSSVSRVIPRSRPGRVLLAVVAVVAAAALGGLLARIGGTAWVGALSAGTAALVLLTAIRGEYRARRILPAVGADAASAPLMKRLRQLPARTTELKKALDRQGVQVHKTVEAQGLQLQQAAQKNGLQVQQAVRREGMQVQQALAMQGMQLQHITELLQGLESHKASRKDVLDTFGQLQAFVQLSTRFDAPPVVPTMRGWAASPDVVLHLVNLLITDQPPIVVECGSGVSTTWMAAAARQYSPGTRIIALDHDEKFAEHTRRNLRDNGLDAWAEVRDAPLEPFGGAGGPLWYATSALEGISDVGLVFIDGPPKNTGPLARKPALDALLPTLLPDAVIILDDTIRRDEQAIVAAWLETCPGLVAETMRFEKGAVELRFDGPDAIAGR
ncbi:class I SAM-dependent methyltransferase [Aeromicrobium flavum]|nr:class I SAM-dependent methyltransferase [Aeromicrobium flavum]